MKLNFNKFPRRKTLLVVGACLMWGLTGCATTGVADAASTDATSQEALLSRATAYWTAVQKGDDVTAWGYEAVSKDPNWTLQNYLKRGAGLAYDAVEVKGVESIQGDKATVKLWMQYSMPMIRLFKQEATVTDDWAVIDGKWFHVFKKSAMTGSK